jgi:hypothetical protein
MKRQEVSRQEEVRKEQESVAEHIPVYDDWE